MSVSLDILKEGFASFNPASKKMKANGTSTLIRDNEVNVVVDTLTAWDREYLTNELKKRGLGCDDITHVVCTHGHFDHIGNLNLFTKAIHIIGYSVADHEECFYHPFPEGVPYHISENIEVFASPGHTLSDVSVLVKNTSFGKVVVSGDLFENKDDIDDPKIWRDVAGSENSELQFKNRDKVLRMADYVIPGHGPMFKVTEELILRHESSFSSTLN